MSDHLKKPLNDSLSAYTKTKILDALSATGKALPATVISVAGSIVKVNFEIGSAFTLPQVTVPVGSSEYIRLPLQPGDKGLVFPATTNISNMSGLGNGTPNLTQRANLSTLTFFPIGNKNFSEVDGNFLVVYGPQGVELRDAANVTSMIINKSGINITAASVDITGNLTVDSYATGVFTTLSGEVVTVNRGLVTNISG